MCLMVIQWVGTGRFRVHQAEYKAGQQAAADGVQPGLRVVGEPRRKSYPPGSHQAEVPAMRSRAGGLRENQTFIYNHDS